MVFFITLRINQTFKNSKVYMFYQMNLQLLFVMVTSSGQNVTM